MKIALLGANGRTGREVLRRALDAGNAVAALVRSSDRLADVTHARLDVHVGSACDAATVAHLVRGSDVVISVLGPRWPTKAASAIYADSAEAIVSAMERSDVRRLLVTSSALLFPADKMIPRIVKRIVPAIVDAAQRMETRIKAASVDWTIARTSYLNDGHELRYDLGVDKLAGDGGAVSRSAVATFLLSEAEAPMHIRRVVGLSG